MTILNERMHINHINMYYFWRKWLYSWWAYYENVPSMVLLEDERTMLVLVWLKMTILLMHLIVVQSGSFSHKVRWNGMSAEKANFRLWMWIIAGTWWLIWIKMSEMPMIYRLTDFVVSLQAVHLTPWPCASLSSTFGVCLLDMEDVSNKMLQWYNLRLWYENYLLGLLSRAAVSRDHRYLKCQDSVLVVLWALLLFLRDSSCSKICTFKVCVF